MCHSTNQSRLGLLLCGLAVLLLPATAQSAEPAADAKLAELKTRFQAGLDAIREKYDLPGMTAAYALPDGQVVAFSSGLADKETGKKMTPQTRMPAGSVGKTFVAATALGLAQDGKLSLDDKIEKWLGDEPWFDQLPGARDITVRHLMMHRSGVADHVYDPQFAVEAKKMTGALDTNPDAYFKPRELVRFILNRKPLFAPGEGFKYTDTGYILLGLVIERAGGASYYDQVRRRFLEPLELDDTRPADRRDLANLAAGYLAADNPFGLPQKITTDDGVMRYNPLTEWTGGGLVSTPENLVRWFKALYEGKALTKPYVEELVAADPHDQGKKEWYGLGVYVNHRESGTGYGHGGWSPGYLTHVDYFPAQKVAIAVQVNSDARDDMLGEVLGLMVDVLQTVGKAP
jgi:D-alanyl-D-alanine carboxypeptidase